MTLPHKTAWITGAASGLGRALALALARRGIAVAASVKLQLVGPGFVGAAPAHEGRSGVTAERAAERIMGGLETGRFEITIPRRSRWKAKLLRLLPYRLYFAIARRGQAG